MLPHRVALLSVHTSPRDRPGTGDAGGLNVYVVETSKRMAEAGVEVEIFTRSTSSNLAPASELFPGVTVRHVTAGPFEGLLKEDLPAQLCAVSAGVMRVEASRAEGWYDLVHSHYWLSGQVGWLAAERWDIPLVHTMHTMARVKNAALAIGDTPEPEVRIIGEQQVVDIASRLVANTAIEANELIDLYDAEPARVRVVHPGVDLQMFSPGDRAAARAELGVSADAQLLLFVGRIQPLKAPDVLVRAAAEIIAADPQARRTLTVAVLGGPSGTGMERPDSIVELASELAISDLVRLEPPSSRERLAQWFRAADLTVVPSYNESFGLVAIESQACGTPVVAANVGGLPTAVNNGVSGVLVDGHNPADWARVITALLRDPDRLATMRIDARAHAEHFGWQATTDALLDVYAEAMTDHQQRPSRVNLV